MSTTPPEPSIPLGEDYSEIREACGAICADFPGEYWRELDEREAYPEEFVNALTEQGYLAVLIPEEYGGAGLPLRAAGVILEECHAARLLRRGLPRADVHHGLAAAPRQPGAEGGVPAADRERRAAPAGLRRDRAHHRHRHHEAEDARRPRRRPLPRDRARRSGPRARCTPT